MGDYSSEQGGRHATDETDRTLADDLRPWLRNTIDADLILSEMPYYQTVGEDIPVEEDDRAKSWLDRHADTISDIPRSIRRKGPYRTDLVAAPLDYEALKTRYARVGRLTSMNGDRSTKRRRRRTYCNFIRDGPMRRDYYETKHGGPDGAQELHGYGAGSASPAFAWLKERGFLLPVDDETKQWDAVELPWAFTDLHAIELKLQRAEWDTALEQVQRAACYAGYQWVAMGPQSIQTAMENQERFRNAGVGLLRVSPNDGVSVVVDAAYDPPEMTDHLFNHYTVARWDVNERLLKQVEPASNDPDAEIPVDVEDVSLVEFPPLVNGGSAGGQQPAYEETQQLAFDDF